MISAEKINCAETAFRLVCDGADPVEVVSRCEINGLFERRDWVATIHGVGTVLGVVRQPEFVRQLVSEWQDTESTLVWCLYDNEQSRLHQLIGGESLDGSTPVDKRIESVERFKQCESRVLISKPQILGFGLNLQIATRQVFSGLQDSYEKYYQCVKRSNRIGSTKPLNVHIPVTELEVPMVETVLRKAGRVEQDTKEQELLFKEASCS